MKKSQKEYKMIFLISVFAAPPSVGDFFLRPSFLQFGQIITREFIIRGSKGN